MRALFSFAGGIGHAQPMVPVARALQEAGHEVRFAGDARYLKAVQAQGFATSAVDDGEPIARSGRQPLVQPDQENEDRVVVEHFAGELPRRRSRALIELCSSWPPDLLVRDEVDLTAALVGERLSLPRAVVQVLAAGRLLQAPGLAQALDQLRAQHALAPDPQLLQLVAQLVLSPFPTSFRADAAQRFSIGPAAPPQAVPGWWSQLGPGPLVHLTLGTVFPLESGDLLERLVAGLRELPVELVVTTGPDLDPDALGPQPAHVHVERWLSPALLLPRASLVVHHGGSGSLLAAAAQGRAQIVVALGADQLHNAVLVEQLGIGRALDPVRLRPEEVAQAAAALLQDEPTRAAAGRVRDEIAQLPAACCLVPSLERLAGS